MKIPFYKPTGKRVYFKRSEVDEWLIQNRHKSRREIEQEATNYVYGRELKRRDDLYKVKN